ncbi:hypothetical protein K0M31_000696, partial [Melipona bicolor]
AALKVRGKKEPGPGLLKRADALRKCTAEIQGGRRRERRERRETEETKTTTKTHGQRLNIETRTNGRTMLE